MIEFQLPEMTCGHCAGMVSQALKLVDPSCKVQIDLAQRRVLVESSEDRQSLAEALTDAGYAPAS
jgi:copper chaperone